MTYYHVTFSYGETINLGRCVISSQDDTTLTQYWNSTESAYKSFTDLNIVPGERILFTEGNKSRILLARVSSVTSSVITLSSNPGQRAYNRILQNGFITPFIERDLNVYSYRLDKYVGASLTKNGQSFLSFAESNPLGSDATNNTNHSVISLFFEKGKSTGFPRAGLEANSSAQFNAVF